MGNVHLISRRVRLYTCPRCGVSLFAGIAEGLPFRVDPIPLTIEGELTAVLQGRWTYGWNAGIQQLYYRDEHRMRKIPRPAVLYDHRCHQPLIQYVDLKWMESIARAVRYLIPPDDDELTEKEENAIMTIGQVLGGRMIEEIPPF